MKKIILIVPYFGKWPLWINYHFESICSNKSIDWLFVTDCEIPKRGMKNVIFKKMTMEYFNLMINEKLNLNISMSFKKVCDIRPAFGIIFEDFMKDYQFWGVTDTDIIYGDIRKFITIDVLNNYDIISSRKGNLSGHFTLFRNNKEINNPI